MTTFINTWVDGLIYKDLEKILSSKEESIFTFKNKNVEITGISGSQLSDFFRAFFTLFEILNNYLDNYIKSGYHVGLV
jgi:hypothetical protein